MKQNRDCKIVQDLLPNYIEKLTDEITNEYIEEHISKCSECAEILINMNTEIDVDQITQDQEVKYLKKLKRKWIQSIPIIAIIIIIIAASIIGYINYKSQMQVNNYTFLKCEFTFEDKKNTEDGNIYGTLIAVIDEEEICKSIRIIIKGYNKEYIKKYYTLINESNYNIYSNKEIVENTIHYNVNKWNGHKKEELLKYLKEHYNIQNIEEL